MKKNWGFKKRKGKKEEDTMNPFNLNRAFL